MVLHWYLLSDERGRPSETMPGSVCGWNWSKYSTMLVQDEQIIVVPLLSMSVCATWPFRNMDLGHRVDVAYMFWGLDESSRRCKAPNMERHLSTPPLTFPDEINDMLYLILNLISISTDFYSRPTCYSAPYFSFRKVLVYQVDLEWIIIETMGFLQVSVRWDKSRLIFYW